MSKIAEIKSRLFPKKNKEKMKKGSNSWIPVARIFLVVDIGFCVYRTALFILEIMEPSPFFSKELQAELEKYTQSKAQLNVTIASITFGRLLWILFDLFVLVGIKKPKYKWRSTAWFYVSAISWPVSLFSLVGSVYFLSLHEKNPFGVVFDVVSLLVWALTIAFVRVMLNRMPDEGEEEEEENVNLIEQM